MNYKTFLIFCFSSVSMLFAEMNGKQLYTMYCGACHGIEGQGGAGGSAPPVAKSPWVQGDPVRPIKILLHGIQGEISLEGKTYNLMMPPQGGMLKDDQIAKILTYVRGNMGNDKFGKPAPISAEQVSKVRAETADQEGMYFTKTLQHLHPFPKPNEVPSPITGLVMHTFYNKSGVWNKMPDLENLQADAVEEEHKGILSLRDQDHKKSFAVLWEGRLDAQTAGDYLFTMRVDDGLRLYVNETLVVSEEIIGPLSRKPKSGKINVPVGQHDLRIEYFQGGGAAALELFVTPPNGKPILLTEKPEVKKANAERKYPTIEIKPDKGEAVSYRNFMEGNSLRTISFGYPNGLNYTFSQEHCNVQVLWKGKFIDSGLRWTGRGLGRTKPYGENIVDLNRFEGVQLTIGGNEIGVDFWKYELDEKRYPTFFYKVKGHPEITMTDRYDPKPDNTGFMRTLELKGDGVRMVHVPIKQAVESPLIVATPQGHGNQPRYFFDVAKVGKTYTFDYSW